MSDSRLLASIDIGSTWTKGALFRRAGEDLAVAEQAAHATTVDDLTIGFDRVLRDLLPQHLRGLPLEAVAQRCPIRFSSSAKGGLSIIAVGLVPELTGIMAERAAQAAGGKVVGVYAYKLCPEDLDAINAAAPDILLLAGGTDGGNESYLLHNATVLRSLRPETMVIFAGNRCARHSVCAILADHDCVIADNLLPTLDKPAPEDANRAIRTVFLERIVAGKGLDRLVAATGSAPRPTPAAVLSWMERAAGRIDGHDGVILIDLGGATTDVYSAVDEPEPEAGAIRRGLPEPVVKRTVDGDLGMRINAVHAAAILNASPQLRDWARRVTNDPARLPDNAPERDQERALAEGIVELALRRHAGSRRQVYTADGPRWIVSGKDLRPTTLLIGSGGLLGRIPDLRMPAGDDEHLLPERLAYAADVAGLIPLAANLIDDHPDAAVRVVAQHLIRREEGAWN